MRVLEIIKDGIGTSTGVIAFSRQVNKALADTAIRDEHEGQEQKHEESAHLYSPDKS